VQLGQVGVAHPAEHDVLLDGESHVVVGVLRAMSASARIWSDVMSPSGSLTVATAYPPALRPDVGLVPRAKLLREAAVRRERSALADRLLGVVGQASR
jgi:hypothetical protein